MASATGPRRAFLDTNVLVYALDAADPWKQQLARALLLRSELRFVVSPQVLLELHAAAQRKLRLGEEVARAAVARAAELARVIPADGDLVVRAAERVRSSRLSIWDACVVEAALRAGCDTLFTEDLQHGARFGDLAVEDPFRSAVSER